ncbi:MAG: DUF262 domain-containing HNH endonuclease family protein [Chitinophagales bacterium]|nr:DUF262 domain-containing HNH endonuclease family protein [Chitinophagales bacterium]MDW8419167.1 DUF262 domain-containing HNH endonuclease family protein [Chitinophagales bacterium]
MKGITDTSSVTFRQLMGNGLRYVIPKFQRDYTWDTEQWDDLWFDIQQLWNKNTHEHYMGYLVLQSLDNKSFQIIDGQQRLTTLSILALVVLKCIQDLIDKGEDAGNNQKRIETLRSSFIGYTDPVTLNTDNKLRLNRNGDSYYRNYLVLLKDLPRRNINRSEKGMRDCFIWFYERVRKAYTTGVQLATFLEELSDKLFFTRIIVSDDFNAFRVFETLNARGVQLSASDLLKNYLFSVVDESHPHQNEIEELENLWSSVIDKLKSEKFEEYLRYYWNSRHKIVRKNQLYKAIRNSIRSKGEVFYLVRELDEYADLFIALQNPEDEFWAGKQELKKYLKELHLFQIRQHLSLFMSAYKKLSEEDFTHLARAISVISFRYNVIGGYNPNEQEEVYNRVAIKIFREGAFKTDDLEEVYVGDKKFETDFEHKVFKSSSRNHKIIKYILGKVERQQFQNELNIESDLFTVEHILPESADDTWGDFDMEAIQRSVYRIGNLTLLEKHLNKEAANLSYSEKKEIYRNSSCELTRKIADEYDTWTEEYIADRQKKLARYAKGIWKL